MIPEELVHATAIERSRNQAIACSVISVSAFLPSISVKNLETGILNTPLINDEDIIKTVDDTIGKKNTSNFGDTLNFLFVFIHGH